MRRSLPGYRRVDRSLTSFHARRISRLPSQDLNMPLTNTNHPIVGTDNFDFMLNGVANLVANEEAATNRPNYHARSDTFDKCDPQQLRLNAAVTAAVTWSFANDTPLLARQSRKQVEDLMRTTDLAQQMKSMGVWSEWDKGTRRRKP
jgi:carboxypeptidase Q